MPGRLIMDQQVLPGSPNPRENGAAGGGMEKPLEEEIATTKAASETHSIKPVQSGPVSAGASHHHHKPTANGDSTGDRMLSTVFRTPPPLDQSWRQSAANKSMRVLIQRMAQQCYSDLNTTLNQMSEVEVISRAPQTNGALPQSEDGSAASLSKKRMFMEFANNQRDRFIKALVLSNWCRADEDMAKLVDIKVWQEKQARAQQDAISFIGTTKHNMIPAKMPNPNIEDAMELLATGRTSRIPDIGYLPVKRLTASQLLKTLRDMNVILAARLNLHENLPHYMNNFSIANGRASFRVPNEFEVDLSVADEDPTSPFYFIDIRFLFTPTSQILNDQLRAHLESMANSALASNGLQGCYEFLHNFVLTHQINVLHSQARNLQRGRWFDCLSIETMRRNLSLQYWSSLPGPKNWLQIGISTGKRQVLRSRKPPTLQLCVQWFRRGVEVTDQSIAVDWGNICVNDVLSRVITSHITWALTNIRESLRAMAGEGTKLNAQLNASSEIPEDCSLIISLPSMTTSLTVKIQPVTGQLSISPPTPSTTRLESRLSQDASADIPRLLGNLLCSTLQERVGLVAELLGWLPVSLMKQDDLKKVLGANVWQLSAFACHQGWGDNWALLVAFDLNGAHWFVARLKQTPNENDQAVGRVISMAKPIRVASVLDGTTSISRHTMLEIEKLATAEVTLTALAQQLTSLNIDHRFERLVPLTSRDGSAYPTTDLSACIALFIRTSDLLRDSKPSKPKAIASGSIRVTHGGFEMDEVPGEDLPQVKHELRVTVSPGRLQHLQRHLAHGRDSNVAMSASGGLALRLRTTFGHPFVEQVQSRLRNAERLDHYLAVLDAHKFPCTTASLSRLVFTYSSAPSLGARLAFSKDGGVPVRLTFDPPASNPHQRIRVMLESGINHSRRGATGGGPGGSGSDVFTALVRILLFTAPLLQALDRLDADGPAAGVVVHARQPTWYTVAYTDPAVKFEIRARKKPKSGGSSGGQEALVWHVGVVSPSGGPTKADQPQQPPPPPKVLEALAPVFQRRGDDWWGLGTGLLAHPHAVGAALDELHRVLATLAGSDAAVKPDHDRDSGAVAAPPPADPPASTSLPATEKAAVRTNGAAPAAPAATAPKQVKKEVIELD